MCFYPQLKERILDASLQHVLQKGFTVQAIDAGARELGYSTSGVIQGRDVAHRTGA